VFTTQHKIPANHLKIFPFNLFIFFLLKKPKDKLNFVSPSHCLKPTIEEKKFHKVYKYKEMEKFTVKNPDIFWLVFSDQKN